MNIKDFVKINGDDLEGECLTLSEKFVYIYDKYSEADNSYTLFSEGLHGKRAKKYLAYRDLLIAGGQKPTDKLIESHVSSDEEVLSDETTRIQLKQERDIYYGLVQAMNAKREMIKTLSFLRKDDTRYAA